MNDSPAVHKDTSTTDKLSEQVEHLFESQNNLNANMTASNHHPPIQHDTMNHCGGLPSTTHSPPLESPTKGTKRKSSMVVDVSIPSVNSHTVNDAVVKEIDSGASTGNTVEKSTGRWTMQEHESFVRGLSMYGREWKRVAQIIPTRTAAQVRSHAQKYLQQLEQSHQQQLLSQHQDLRIHQKENQDDAFDFNFDGWERDSNHISTRDGMVQSNPTGNDGTNATTSMMMLNTMSESVRKQAARILANPISVHHEVNVTLHQLRQRYRELQNRFAQLQNQSSQNNQSTGVTTTTTSGNTDDSTFMETNHQVTSSPSRQQMGEQIVVQVLQARLQQHSFPLSVSEYGEDENHHHHPELNDNSAITNHPDEHLSDHDSDIETDNDEYVNMKSTSHMK
jgi:SHAQKYF class myb-like DNA-binding protein